MRFLKRVFRVVRRNWFSRFPTSKQEDETVFGRIVRNSSSSIWSIEVAGYLCKRLCRIQHECTVRRRRYRRLDCDNLKPGRLFVCLFVFHVLYSLRDKIDDPLRHEGHSTWFNEKLGVQKIITPMAPFVLRDRPTEKEIDCRWLLAARTFRHVWLNTALCIKDQRASLSSANL